MSNEIETSFVQRFDGARVESRGLWWAKALEWGYIPDRPDLTLMNDRRDRLREAVRLDRGEVDTG